MVVPIVSYGDPFRPASNVNSLGMVNYIKGLKNDLAEAQTRLGTGQAQPRVKDGPSYFTISNKKRNQVRGMGEALDNIGDANDMLGVGEAGLRGIDNLLGSIRDLLVRASNGTFPCEMHKDIDQEIQGLLDGINTIAESTEFNGRRLLTGGGTDIQTGPNPDDLLNIVIGDFRVTGSGDTDGTGYACDEVPGDGGGTGDPSDTGDTGGAGGPGGAGGNGNGNGNGGDDDDGNGFGDDMGDISASTPAEAQDSLAIVDDAIDRLKDALNDMGTTGRTLDALADVLAVRMAAEESEASRFGDADASVEAAAINKMQLLEQLAFAQLSAMNAQPGIVLGALLGG